MKKTPALVLICLLFTACPFGRALTTVENALKQVEKAQNDLAANQADWQNILRKLQRDLNGQIDATISGELTTFVDHTVTLGATVTVCTTDIIAKRAQKFLASLKGALSHSGPSTRIMTPPTVCFVPATIEVSDDPSRHRIIQASGADFNDRDINNALLSVVLRSDSKQLEIPLSDARIGRTTKYNLTINLDGDDITKTVRDNEINKILFFWNGSNVDQPQILVTAHIPAADRDESVSIGEVSLIPRLIAGDRGTDINDDNPFVTSLTGKVFVSPDRKHVMYNLYMHGRETQPDHTEVQGWKSEVQTGTRTFRIFGRQLQFPIFGEGPGLVGYTAPEGWEIISVDPAGESAGQKSLTKHTDDFIYQGNGQVVTTFKLNGGEGGGEAGNQTGVIATFRQLTVHLRDKR